MTNRGLVARVCVWVVYAATAFALAACALVDPVDSRYDTVGRSLAKARNEAIFLNLVRASHDYPLSFTTIANVTPTLTNTSTFGLPSFLAGPGAIARVGVGGASTVSTFPSTSPGRDFIFGNTTASNSTAISTNFNVATQETSAFYVGFLKPIDLQTVDYFIRQGYSRELLFWLFADSIQLQAGPHVIGMRYDPPNDNGCDPSDPKHLCIRDYLVIAIAAGLTVEEVTQQSSSGGGAKGGGAGGGGASKPETTVYSRFCFDPVLARKAQSQMGDIWLAAKKAFDVSLAGPRCGSHWDPATEMLRLQPETLNFNVGPYQFKIVPRSAFGIFEFLGAIMKQQRVAPGDPTTPILTTVQDDKSLFTVLPEGSGECFVHTWFNDGDYCVPESATTTKKIFSLLAQLIAIQTAATDLSITPVVRIIQ